MEKVIAVFGYNNTRLYDVKKLKLMLSSQGIGIMLCKEGITTEDKSVSEYCFDTKLHGSHQEICQSYLNFKQWLELQDVDLIGVLPFSDKGILLASYVAEKMDLISDDYKTAITGLDKLEFRKIESNTETPSWYKKPKFQKVENVSDIVQFYNKIKSPVFIKPTCEGNSRGCFLVDSMEGIQNAFQTIKPYLSEGAIVEEYIASASEFSFDTVAGKCWITEKETTTGHHRAEIQQIVPAPLKQVEYDRLIEAGKLVANFSGSKNGAAHNEFFLFSDHKTMTVEPNRRPAGMHIWDLASYAFTDFDPFQTWVNWSIGKQAIVTEVLQAAHYVGLRMIQAHADGTIIEIDKSAIDRISANFDGIIEISLSKNLNDLVWQNPKDNAGFLGYIIAQHQDPNQLKKILADSCNDIAKLVKISADSKEEHDFSMVEKLRKSAEKEKFLVLNCAYLSPFIENWWRNARFNDNDTKNKEQLTKLLLEKFKNQELLHLNAVGVSGHHISAIFMEKLFTCDNPKLAYIVHETLSDLAKINDIKYPYEDHKKIFIKPEGIEEKEWGNGAGAISPHCDDLYEDSNVELLSLTTCRDKFKTPTLVFSASQIFKILSNDEMDRLTKILAVFKSGINVTEGIKEKKRPVLSHTKNNFFMALDFRVDEKRGARMHIENESDLALVQKIKAQLIPDNAMKAASEIGNFVILANRKVLHAREATQAVKELCSLDLDTTPRLLFRSKGPRMTFQKAY